MLGATMERQRRSAAYIASARILAHRALGIARPELLLGKHLVLPCPTVVPLRTDRDLERPHVLRYIDSSDVKGLGLQNLMPSQEAEPARPSEWFSPPLGTRLLDTELRYFDHE